MATRLSSTHHAASHAVETQMRNWELARTQRPAAPEPERSAGVEDFICISRPVGLDTGELASALGEKLGWPVFDRELLELMAGDDLHRRQIYGSMDERDHGWLEEVLDSLVSREFQPNDYFRRLCETVLALARQGCSIFVGRGADLILPQDRGLRVRLVASKPTRLHHFVSLRDLAPKDAEAEIDRKEAEREEFFRRHFRGVSHDTVRFDLCLNLDRFDVAQAVELILAAHRLRG